MGSINRILTGVLLAAFCASELRGNQPDAPASAREVETVALDDGLPFRENEFGGFINAHFAGKPHFQRFKDLTTKDWEETAQAFSEALVQNAKEKGLDAESLSKCMEKIRGHSQGEAIVPIGAYQTNRLMSGVWIIVCRWEHAHSVTFQGQEFNLPLSHFRAYILNASSGEILGVISQM